MPSEGDQVTTSVLEDIKQTRPFKSKSQEAYVTLMRTADDSRRFVSKILEAEGITLQQYNVLRILRGAGPDGLPTLSVAERMIERTPGVTRLIDRMERKGWVRRQRCTEDRRRVWCRITDDGLELLARLDEPIDEIDNMLVGALTPDELDELIEYMNRVRDHVRSMGDWEHPAGAKASRRRAATRSVRGTAPPARSPRRSGRKAPLTCREAAANSSADETGCRTRPRGRQLAVAPPVDEARPRPHLAPLADAATPSSTLT
jgi:DNA-binding MarR family transcriptional regulator